MPVRPPLRASAALFAVSVAFASVAAHAADPQPYTVSIDNTGNDALNEALKSTSLLVTLRNKAPAGPFALVTRAREDIERLLTVLHSFGYYQAKVVMTVDNHGLDDPNTLAALDAVPADQSIVVHAQIALGPVYLLHHIEIDGADDSYKDKLGLVLDRPAIASEILTSSARLLVALQDDGHALAKVDSPVAYADDTAHTIDVVLTATPGPKVVIGAITITGLKDVHEAVVRDAITVATGDPYKPSKIDDARKSVLSLGVFSGVGVHAADKLDDEGRIPINFDATERKMHAVAFTAAYSTDLGVSLSASWSHRNLFGNAEQLNLSASGTGLGGNDTSTLGYALTAQFLKPMFLERNQTLEFDISGLKQSLDAYDQTAQLVGGYLRRKFSALWSGSVGIVGLHDSVSQEGTSATYELVSLPIAASYDSTGVTGLLEDPLRGVRGSIAITPSQPVKHASTFITAQLSGSAYIDASGFTGQAPGRTVIAMRGLIASIMGADTFALPPDQRLYVGGSGSVRGYRYQSIGPLFPSGNPIGATSADSASIELRQRIGEDWGFAAFADAGQASTTRVPFNGDVRVGVGAGVRYYTSIGPVRVDFALPLTKTPGGDAFEIYIGLGQAF